MGKVYQKTQIHDTIMSSMKRTTPHQFHIPVMGTAFTISTPLSVARFGISSVVSIGDDDLCETMREFYAKTYSYPYEPIKKFDEDYRARRITAYLDLLQDIIETQMDSLKALAFEPGNDLSTYFELLPSDSPLKAAYETMLQTEDATKKAAQQSELKNGMILGDIEVNIMTKLDRPNYDKDGQDMGPDFGDACSAFRGFAKSKLRSGIVFSAGFNRRLFAYIEKYPDFFPDETGDIKKKIILKVSDARSSLTQGKFLGKKGVWISEHRIESGLNCGGHAFASDGILLGPILREFKEKRETIKETLYSVCDASLQKLGKDTFKEVPPLVITVQGGIGTAKENQFLLDYFDVDGTGWASPFLLVPEVTTLDATTRELLKNAGESDLYTSPISPLGVPFNTVRGTASEQQKWERFDSGRPGSPCPKGYLVNNLEFTKKPICTASMTYQKRKIAQIKALDTLSDTEKDNQIKNVAEKACLCEDLAASSLINENIEHKWPLKTAVCPGPNLAYFSKIFNLKEMVDHIYGRLNLLNNTYRPNMFVKEISMYITHLTKEIQKTLPEPSPKDIKYLTEYVKNLKEGLNYTQELAAQLQDETDEYRKQMIHEVESIKQALNLLIQETIPALA